MKLAWSEKVQNLRKGKILTMFANMKIASKLLLSFLAITLIGSGLGIFASMDVSKVSDINEKMYNEMLVPQRSIANVTNTFQNVRVTFRNMLHMSEAEIGRHRPGLESTLDFLCTNMDTIVVLLSTDGQKQVEAFNAAMEDYTVQVKNALDRVQSGGKEAVINEILNNGALRQREEELMSILDNLNTLSTKEANAQQKESQKSAEAVRFRTYIVISVQVIISVLIAVVIARSISKPVTRLTKGLNMLADGETDIPWTEVAAKDEIGQMRHAFESIISSIKELIADTSMLIEGATDGRLSVRADEKKHKGAYRRIVEGFNRTLDAITLPIHEAEQVIGELSKGNLNTYMTGDLKGDYAIIKSALNSMIKTLKAYIYEISSVLGEISNGNLVTEITSDYQGDFIELKNSINKIIGSLNMMLTEIDNGAETMLADTRHLSEGSRLMSQSAVEQANAIQDLSASVSQIAEQTQLNADRAESARRFAQKVRLNAETGDRHMQDMQTAMAEINDASSKISGIIKTIDSIAFQTNILSLNAAVEAARAGAYGKGFAVVADEVRNLAAKSASAAKETAELIQGSMQKVAAGTQITDTTARVLSEIVGEAQKAAELIAEMAEVSNEQAAGIQQINSHIEQFSTAVQSNTATAEQAAQASEELRRKAETLKTMVDQFELKRDDSSAIVLNAADQQGNAKTDC